MALPKLPKVTLYCTYGGSDKIYIMWIAKAEDGEGYFIWYQFGARLGGKSKPATKTTTPQTLEAATKAFDKEVLNRKNKKHYTDPAETGQPEMEASSEVVEPPADQRPNVDCMELVAVMDAEAAVRMLRSSEYAAQEKHDGIRLLLHATADKVVGYNRTGGARAYPLAVEREAKKLASVIGSFLLDGELVGEKFYAFDMLEMKGSSYRNDTFEHRMFVLKNWFQLAASMVKAIVMVETSFTETDKLALLERLHGLKREGIVIKKLSARYSAGKSSKEWFKFKFVDMASVIVTKHNERRSVTMSLLHNGQLREVGHLPIPTNKQIPPVNSIVEVRYRKADPNSLNLIETVFLHVRNDVAREDCNTSQLKFTTKAA